MLSALGTWLIITCFEVVSGRGSSESQRVWEQIIDAPQDLRGADVAETSRFLCAFALGNEKRSRYFFNRLRADDYFDGGGWDSEWMGATAVGGDGFGHVQCGEFDALNPESVRRVVGCDVEAPVSDGVSGNFFAMAIAENQDCGRI